MDHFQILNNSKLKNKISQKRLIIVYNPKNKVCK